MTRRIREFIEIRDHLSLHQLIEKLEQVRKTLPPESKPELRLSGCDVFGRRLTISYLRELTQEEQALEARTREQPHSLAMRLSQHRPRIRRHEGRANHGSSRDMPIRSPDPPR